MSAGYSIIVHGAVRYVLEIISLWERDEKLADRQARLIVSQLIQNGFIKGSVHYSGTPIDSAEPDFDKRCA